jgi:glycogen debranching enzyme
MQADGSLPAPELNEWRKSITTIRSDHSDLFRLCERGVADLAGLKLPLRLNHRSVVVPAAGVPWYVALFGRDSLIVSVQTALLDPEFGHGALEILGSLQAKQWDDYRDAEPGKILHELRMGELAFFDQIPQTPYYGTADATPLYLIALHNAWRNTGDRDLVERYLPTARRCLDWIDKYGDRDGDGFQEYETHSSDGYENQGWKDAHDAILYPDGSNVKGPKALCELQGYVFDAWLRTAEIFDEFEMHSQAEALHDKAKALYRHFNEAFWDEGEKFYALALDGDKNKVTTIASNPGHCLWSGIVPRERAKHVVSRLMQPDLYSGWGIRTLSSNHPSYNPHSYQLGSVWPHDNALIALGLKRYGFIKELGRIAGDVVEAGSYFMHHRLPELYSGLKRSETSFPIQYPGANVPQAWASGSVFAFLQAMLGWDCDAPREKLYLDPFLPDWVEEIILKGIRVGSKRVDLRVYSHDGKTTLKVLQGDAEVITVRPQPLFCDRLAAHIAENLPEPRDRFGT